MTTFESNPARRARAPLESIARLHRLLLSLFGSGEQFRRWIALGPRGQDLVAELPERPTSTAAALLDGLDLLMRRGHVDAEFFARLAEEFPGRADDISRVFTSGHSYATALARGSPRRYILPGIAALTVAVGMALLGLVLAARVVTPQALVLGEDPPLEARGDGIIVPPSVDPAPRTAPRSPQRPGKSRPPLARHVGQVLHASYAPRVLPASACELPPGFGKELAALARESIASPAIAERFTVVLRAHAESADVSPRPQPGQATQRQIHERIVQLSPEALARCRDIPVDITLSHGRTTLTPRLP